MRMKTPKAPYAWMVPSWIPGPIRGKMPNKNPRLKAQSRSMVPESRHRGETMTPRRQTTQRWNSTVEARSRSLRAQKNPAIRPKLTGCRTDISSPGCRCGWFRTRWLYEEVDSEFRSGKFRNWLPLASRQAHCIPHATVEKMHSLSACSERSVLHLC